MISIVTFKKHNVYLEVIGTIQVKIHHEKKYSRNEIVSSARILFNKKFPYKGYIAVKIDTKK